MWLLFVAILLFIFISSTFYLIIFQRLIRLGIQPIQYELRRANDADPNDVQGVPAALVPLFQVPLQHLQAQGFEPMGALAVQPLIHGGPRKEWELLLFHPQWQTYAHISLRHPIEPALWYHVAFYSFFQDRTLLLTLNGAAHSLIGTLPQTQVQDFYTADLAAQWRGHQQRLESWSQLPVKIPKPLYVDVLNDHYDRYLKHLWDQGQIIAAPQQALHKLSLPTAMAVTWRIARGHRQTVQLLKAYVARAQQEPDGQIEIPIELEVENFERMGQMEAGAVRRSAGSSWAFGVSLALLGLSLRAFGDGWGLLMLVGAIALHELGHFLAMGLLGYRETAIFFLPFLGGVATGHKAHASLSEKIIVLLSGPLPGLALGLGGLLWQTLGSLQSSPQSPWLWEGSIILVGFNLFNLLPIYPLDGGKIAYLLLFSRYPWADVGFKLGAIAALSALSWFSPLLLLLAVGVGLSIPHSFRSAKLQSSLKNSLKTSEGASLPETWKSQGANRPLEGLDRPYLQAIFQTLRDSGYGKRSFEQRYAIAKDVWERQREAQASGRTRLVLGLVYLFCLVGLPMGAIAHFPMFSALASASSPVYSALRGPGGS